MTNNDLTPIVNQLERLIKAIDKVESSNKLFNLVSYDTVFTVCTTLAVFIFGIIVNRIILYCDRISSEKKLRIYFATYLNKIAEIFAPKLSDQYKKFYQETSIDSGFTYNSPEIFSDDFKRIRNIGDKELYFAIKNKKSLSIILSNIDFIERLIYKVNEYHTYISALDEKLRKKLGKKINQYFDLLANYVEHVKIDNPQYPNRDNFRDLVNDSIIKYHAEITGTRQITRLYKEIIRPIQEQVINTDIIRSDDHGFQIAQLGKDISLNFNELRRLTIAVRLEYRKFAKLVDDSKIKLIDEKFNIN